MKNLSIFLLIVLTITLFTTCGLSYQKQENSNLNQNATSLYSTDNHESITNLEETSIKDVGGADIVPRKYRTRYYSVAYQFAELVGVDNYWNWADTYNTENPDDTNEMVIKNFVQYFNITREDFDKANLTFGKILAEGVDISLCLDPKDYADQEIYEIYNADIIYTFDDKIINEYYLTPDYAFGWRIEYEQAVADGTYQTRTTDWVDIEQMEAEVIAKYGEAEIVTETTLPDETTTAIPEEITTTEQAATETTE